MLRKDEFPRFLGRQPRRYLKEQDSDFCSLDDAVFVAGEGRDRQNADEELTGGNAMWSHSTTAYFSAESIFAKRQYASQSVGRRPSQYPFSSARLCERGGSDFGLLSHAL